MNPIRRRALDAKRQRERRKVNIAKGLCRCGNKPDPGFTQCPRCQKRKREYSRIRDRRGMPAKRTFGICIAHACQKESVPGYSFCGWHLEYRAELERDRRQERIAKGVCAKCQQPPEPGKTLCAHHLQKSAESQASYKAKKIRKRDAA